MQLLCCLKKPKVQSLGILHISNFAFLEKMALLTWVFYISNTETSKINEIWKGWIYMH